MLESARIKASFHRYLRALDRALSLLEKDASAIALTDDELTLPPPISESCDAACVARRVSRVYVV